MHDVITFGSATVDIHVDPFEEHVFEYTTPEHVEKMLAFPSGGKILVEKLQIGIGGGGTNTATCMKRLGLHVAYCGNLGNDRHGDDVIDWLKKHKIEFLGCRTDNQTNMSVVLDCEKFKDRTILTYRDASSQLCTTHLNLKNLQAKWFYFSSLLGKSYDTMKVLVKYAKTHGISVAFNPSQYQVKQGLSSIKGLLQSSNVFVLNNEEAALLVGVGSPSEQCVRLRDQGAETVIVTNGGEGASLLHEDTIYEANQKKGIKVVETTGAGDCFSSSFIAGLVMGKSPKQSFRLALVNAESLITKIGAKNGLLNKQQAMMKLATDHRNIKTYKI